MYAILETGGKQYKVRPGDTLRVERLDAQAGETVELDRVLMVANDDQVSIGAPLVGGARVLAEVMGESRGPKTVVLKYKAKVRYRRKSGHRQTLTTLRIKEIHGATKDGT